MRRRLLMRRLLPSSMTQRRRSDRTSACGSFKYLGLRARKFWESPKHGQAAICAPVPGVRAASASDAMLAQ
eukprot:2390371-Prymnesium_polylepis.1